MRISDIKLSKEDNNYESNSEKEVNVYRIILLLCSTVALILRYIFIKEYPNAYDPLEARIAFSSILLVIFVLTYIENIDKWISTLTYLIFVSYSGYGVLLIFKNNFAVPYILEFIILIIIVCLAFNKRIYVYIYLTLVFVLFVGASVVYIQNLVDIFVNISLVGIFCGAVLIFFDLRIETEEKIRVREGLLNTVFNESPDALFIIDPIDATIINCNNRSIEMFELGEQQNIIGNNFDYILKYSYSSEAWAELIADVEKDSFHAHEAEFKTNTGNIFWGSQAITKIDIGDSVYWLVRVSDVTERKKVEKIQRDSERKFRALIENSSDIIIILNEAFILQYISPSVSRILGFNPDKIVSLSVFELIHDEEIDRVSKFLSEIISNPNQKHVLDEVKIKTGDQSFIYSEVVATNMFDDSVINGIVINCHDITQRIYTEKELLNTNFELDSFVYKASHDLKAPLRSVMGLIKLAQLESEYERTQLYLDMMNKSVHSLDQFIKDLTLFSRNSRLEVEARVINFENLINESLGNLKFMENVNKVTVNKNINIKCDFYSDITRLSMIINNLISNAFKYHRFENNNSYINIIIEGDEQKANIILEDNGQGIDPLHIDRIFDMFYRASESSYGSGLGLYIVKNAVSKLNGTISVKSTLNQGTVFTIMIPNQINKVEKNEA